MEWPVCKASLQTLLLSLVLLFLGKYGVFAGTQMQMLERPRD